MKLSEARSIAAKVSVPDFVLSSMTANDAIEVEQAFAVMVDVLLSSAGILIGKVDDTGKTLLDPVICSGIVESTGISNVILALRNNKNFPPEMSLRNVLGRMILGRLQNDGDRYEIDYKTFKIGFTLRETIKHKYDSVGIAAEAGVNVTTEIINKDLVTCFKTASAAINPTGCDQAIDDGKLNLKYRTDVKSVNVLIDFTWKEEDK